MPQLNPAPWLFILVFAWLVIIVIIPPKILAHTLPNNPDPQSTKLSKTSPWTWT